MLETAPSEVTQFLRTRLFLTQNITRLQAWSLYYASETQICAARVFFSVIILLQFRWPQICDLMDICWDTPSENISLWQLSRVSSVLSMLFTCSNTCLWTFLCLINHFCITGFMYIVPWTTDPQILYKGCWQSFGLPLLNKSHPHVDWHVACSSLGAYAILWADQQCNKGNWLVNFIFYKFG